MDGRSSHYKWPSRPTMVYIRSCHDFLALLQVTIRHAKSHPHPKLTNLKLMHNRLVDRDAMAVKLRLGGKLIGEQAQQVGKMAGETRFRVREVTTPILNLCAHYLYDPYHLCVSVFRPVAGQAIKAEAMEMQADTRCRD